MADLLTTDTRMRCPHAGTVTATPGQFKAKAGGALVVRAGDQFVIAGCTFLIGNTPHPCVRVTWSSPALKSTASGDAPLNTSSVGMCVAADEARQGAVIIDSTQAKVAGQ